MISLLITSLHANLALAGWSNSSSPGNYNQRFGDFPPLDIDQQLQDNLETMEANEKSEGNQSLDNSESNTYGANQTETSPVQNNAEKNYQEPGYGNYNRSRSSRPRSNNRRSGFSSPWNNNRSGFGMPWNNSSGFSGPWDNNGSSFSAPWNNRGSGFSMPWSNNGSGFSGPWDNNNRSNSKKKRSGWSW